MSKNSRIVKWRKYREEIDSNNNIHLSIINSNPELKELFESIDFNVEEAYIKSGYTNSKSNVYTKPTTTKEKQNKLKSILKSIEKNEEAKTKSTVPDQLNSHKYDKWINEYFLEFVDKNDLDNKKDQETTDLKINKITIDNKGDNNE